MSEREILTKIYREFEDSVNEWNICSKIGCNEKKCYDNLLVLDEAAKLYHYTTINALFSIASSGILRLSNCMVLNDSRESKHTQSIISEVIDDNPIIKSSVDLTNRNFKKLFDMDNVFILSLSVCDDSMPMWYNYASGDGCNFSINYSRLKQQEANWKNKFLLTKYPQHDFGLDKAVIERVLSQTHNDGNKENAAKEIMSIINSFHDIDKSKASWFIDHNNELELTDEPAWGYADTQFWFYDISKVIYCKDKQKRIIQSLLNCYVNARKNAKYKGYSRAINSALIRKLKRCMIFFKDSMFYPEEEVRFAVIIHPSLLEHIICFYEKRGAFIPYIQFDIRSNQSSSYMQNIVVGPGNKLDIAPASIRHYLKHIGCKEPLVVKNSDAPLRYYK